MAGTYDTGYQHPLGLSPHYSPERVALYSGGLDSAAGLANRVLDGVHRYALVTVGHQSGLRRKALRQVAQLRQTLHIEPPIHSTVVTAIRGGGSIRLSQQERTQRTRSFLFSSCAVVVANAFRIADIDVFENGVGSINLPVMTGMLIGGLATRGSHPSFLRKMSTLASAIAELPIRFNLPFATMTKGEMLKPLCEQFGLSQWLQSSSSCVHSSIRVPGITHCGLCPACIERRQAFRVAGIHESGTYCDDVFVEPPVSGPEADYFQLYRDEARAWLSAEPRSRRRMDTHLRVTGVPSEQHLQINDLQTRHSQEVLAVYGNPLEVK